MQVAFALIFSSYVVIFPIASVAWLVLSPLLLNVFSWRSLCSFSALYTLQLFAYRPQLSKGWPFHWLLYGPPTDYCLGYYDATCIREGPPLDPKGHYLFAMYPHGIYGVCRLFSGGVGLWTKLFPGIAARWGSFSAAFYIPGIREFSLWAGTLDASKPVLERAIRRGENITLLPGGIDEMNLTDGSAKDTKLVMVERKGFVKLAIEHGMDIVPGFCFGEKWIHEVVRLPKFIRQFLRPFRMSGTLLKGRGLTLLGFLEPSLGFVWGEPIKVRQQSPVDEAYLDEVHKQVMESVESIFHRYKKRFGYPDDETLTLVSPAEAKAAIGEARRSISEKKLS